jgi:hypothetical protein
MKSLYVARNVLNGKDIEKWAKDEGFTNIMNPSDMHVTIAYSKKKIDWSKLSEQNNKINIKGGKRSIVRLGDEGAIVIKFESNKLQDRFDEFIDAGCSWDYDSYQPHISFSYNGMKGSLNDIKIYDEPILLGPEKFKELDENWKDKLKLDK